MAGNEWINGYLEAILDAGGGGGGGAPGGANLVGNRKNFVVSLKEPTQQTSRFEFSPTKYFVEEVINSFEETDLHRTWIKVIATRNTRERNNRLENMCWRIWHLARKKKQIEWDDSRRLAKRRLEREQGRHDAAADLSELSEGEKEKGETNQAESLTRSFSRINSDLQIWSEDNPNKRLYIVLISLHGLVRGENMELGRDSDTGGQVKYVVELAKALAATKGVNRVDLLTRQISSPDVDWSYGEPIEMLSSSSSDPDATGGGAAYIIRLPCGPPEKYIPKESLWPYIPEFVDRALAHIAGVARALGGEEPGTGKSPVNWPYVIHGHYADAGEAAARLSGMLNVPMVLTGHSLGRNKFEQLLKQGRLSREDINATYRILRRIEAEEMGLDAAEMVVTSTRQEIEEQWGLYDGFDVKLERKLRVRRRRGVSCLGRYMPRMVVIPPGMDFSNVNPQDEAAADGDLRALIGTDRAQATKTNLPPIWSEIMRFFTNPHKPMILALSRPDPKKNVTTLLKAFGECRPLKELANLTLILGNRDDIEEMPAGSSTVLTAVLKLIDRYDLYGQVAYPKHHKQSEVPHIYRLAAKTKGVFINPALVEPFGLTLIEAAAYGLPTVATKNGGPVDIHKALNNGLLVDPHDQKAIADALLKLVADKNMWLECRKSGLKNIHRYSWPEHCRNYLSHVEHCRSRHPVARRAAAATPLGAAQSVPDQEEPMSDSLRDVDDLSIKFSVDIVDAAAKSNGDAALDAAARQKAVIDALGARPTRVPNSSVRATRAFGPGRRRRLFVIAADCYRADGAADLDALRGIVSGVMAAGATARSGFVYLTGSTLGETVEMLRRCDIPVEDFDAVVCCSGSEVYYPWKDLTAADAEYNAQIEYKWPGENVQSAIPRLARTDAGGSREDDDVLRDAEASSSRCYAYSVKPGAKVRRIDDIRQRLRMRAFRCNPVYVRAATRLNVVPLFASRANALRYLSIRWGIDLSGMVVFVSEKGDTDHEDLFVGLHKTVVFGAGEDAVGSGDLVRGPESYRRDDVVALDSLNLFRIRQGFNADDIFEILQVLG